MPHYRANSRKPNTLSSRNMPSPPISPVTSDREASSSIEENLEGSFLMVTGDEDETASTFGSSTVGSIHDSLLGEISSDSSGEEHAGRERWEDSTDEESDADPELSHTDAVLLSSPSVPSGEWTDAEATISDLTDSRSTAAKPTLSPSSSQVRLIMPDPASSFCTSSDSTTPSGSILHLKPIPSEIVRGKNERRGVDQSWLEASSKLWNIAPEVQSMISEDGFGLRKVEDIAGPYALLSSQENVKEPYLVAEKDERSGQHKAVDESSARRKLRTAFVTSNLAGLKGLARKWSVQISMLTLASVISVAVYRSLASSTSSVNPFDTQTQDTLITTNLPILPVGRTFSIWDSLSPASSEASTTKKFPLSGATLTTQRLPDLNLIKQALSTFSTDPVKGTVSDPTTTDKTHGRKQLDEQYDQNSGRGSHKAASRKSSDCCAVSVRNIDALAITNKNPVIVTADKAWSKVLRDIRRTPVVNLTDKPAGNATALAEPCTCSSTHHFRMEMMSRLNKTFSLAPQYVVSAANVLGSIYQPAIAELQKEFAELIALTRALAETSSTLTQFVIRHAGRGVSVARRSLEIATRRLRAYIPPLQSRSLADNDAIARAREQLDHLSEYVEDQAATIAEYVEEQTSAMHEKGMESLRQAKRGLDKVIFEARRVVDGEEHAKRNKPMPFVRLNSKRYRSTKDFGNRQKEGDTRRWRRSRDSRVDVSPPPSQERSVGRKFLDLIHHGAVALVV